MTDSDMVVADCSVLRLDLTNSIWTITSLTPKGRALSVTNPTQSKAQRVFTQAAGLIPRLKKVSFKWRLQTKDRKERLGVNTERD
jgi:hypothetical protein